MDKHILVAFYIIYYILHLVICYEGYCRVLNKVRNRTLCNFSSSFDHIISIGIINHCILVRRMHRSLVS